jgi:zinc/manganese transport system substrate-binding protein
LRLRKADRRNAAAGVTAPWLVLVMTLSGCADTDSRADAASPGSASSTARSAPSEGSPSATSSATPGIHVVTSTDVYGDITRTIGEERVTVTEIITSAGQDPHSFEASPRNQLAFADAHLVIENGGGYDDFMSRLRSASDTDAASIIAFELTGSATTDDEAEPEPAEATENHVGDGANEHVWYDLDAIAIFAEEVADALAELEPGSRETFERNAADFVEGITDLQSRLDTIRAEHRGKAVAVTEPLPMYLIEDAGLVNRTPDEFSEAIEEGTDVPVRVLQETLVLLTDNQVEVLVYNEQTTGPQTEQVREAAESNSLPVVAVSETLPEGSDYLTWMRANIAALEEALR